MTTNFLRKIKIFLLVCGLVMLLLPASWPRPVQAQDPTQDFDLAVQTAFEALTPAERVGQLFLVSFTGTDVGPESTIATLIQRYRIGGVLISAENRNFTNDQDTPGQVLALTNGLQALAQQPPPAVSLEDRAAVAASETLTATASTLETTTDYNPTPLFIAVEHEGDGFPFTQIRGGMTSLPSAMALAATWETDNARQIGALVGRDLSLLGVNMLLGPSLDVLDNPRLVRGNALGVRTFGGNPYWVGEMGHAYIRGIHEGSGGRLLTIAKHFPGFGSSDREVNLGVPTILKSLDDLRRVELRPFFRVTAPDADSPDGITDGLMTAHARYQGLQGNVPISLDARNLPAILALKEFSPWRSSGGLVVSAPLGAPAALEGISAGRDTFPARRLAQDAFLAGNDLLQLVGFAFDKNNAEAQLANIQDAIGFFQERYASDPNFKAGVDQRVHRILKAKVKLYGLDLFQADIQNDETALTALGADQVDLNEIARAGVTLITPSTQQQSARLTNPPQPGENILIFVDDRLGQDCMTCPEFPLIETSALEEILLRLFGPNATGQLSPEQITSLGFSDLKQALSRQPSAGDEAAAAPEETEEGGGTTDVLPETPDETNDTEALIQAADWIIFGMLDIDTDSAPQSDAVRLLLRNRYDALRNKNLVMFAFNAPYFLDETEISQLTAYYGFYSKMPYYLEAAAQLLFQQFEPAGASPVAIPAIGPLDLSPDPDQLIDLIPVHRIDTRGNITPIDNGEQIDTIDLEVGESILFRTSVIVDRNGHPVPNGTLVDFFRYYPLEGLSLEPLQSRTVQGVAEITIVKERDTPLQVRASSNLAVQSVTFNIGPGIVETPTPTPTLTPLPTDTPTPTPTATDTPTPELTPTPDLAITPTVTPLPSLDPPLTNRPVNMIDLVYSLLGSLLIGGIAFTLGGERFMLEERVRSALVPIAAGLVGYIFYTIAAMTFSQASYMQILVRQNLIGHWVAPLISVLFAIVGVIGWHLKPGRVFWRERRGG